MSEPIIPISDEEAEAAAADYETAIQLIDSEAASQIIDLIGQIQTICNAAKQDAVDAYSSYSSEMEAAGRTVPEKYRSAYELGTVSKTYFAVKSKPVRLLEHPNYYRNFGLRSLYRISGQQQPETDSRLI